MINDITPENYRFWSIITNRGQALNKKTIVLDTSAFIAGFDPMTISEKQYTVSEVLDELNSGSMPWMRLKAASEKGKIEILKPKETFLQKIIAASKKVGDINNLSIVDMKVLALALELKNKGLIPLIITDDYSIQNVANKIDVEFTSLNTFGIKFRFNWIMYCPACFRKYPPEHNSHVCNTCGTELKRKPKKRIRL